MRGLGCVMLGLCMLAQGCVRTLPGQDPPPGARFYFPNRMALSSDARSLFVVSTNFDERYNVGWVTRVDMATLLPLLDAAAQSGTPVNAQGAAAALRQSVRVPSLGGDLVIDDAHARAYLAHRGQGVITTLELVADAQNVLDIHCGNAQAAGAQAGLTHLEQQTSCDRAHLFDLGRASLAQDRDVDPARWSDPFALALVATPQHEHPALMTGFLSDSTLLALQPGDSAEALGLVAKVPLSSATLGNLLAVPATEGASQTLGGTLIGTTHYSPVQSARGAIISLDVAAAMQDPNNAAAFLRRYDLGAALGANDSSADITGVVFSPNDASRLFVAHHGPAALVLLEREVRSFSKVSASAQLEHYEDMTNQVRVSRPLGQDRLSQMAYMPRPDPQGDALAVLNLSGDVMYLYDVSHDGLMLAGRYSFAPGQGPVDIVHLAHDAHHYLFVTTFFDHGLTVLDVPSDNLGDIRLVAKIQDTTQLRADAQP